MSIPQITDRHALARNRARAAAMDEADSLFLHAQAADEIQERLTEVNKTFTNIAIVTGAPAFWAARYPGAALISDDETLALGPGTFDLICHVMALHWANDPVGQLVQCRRALRPDGLLLCICPGGQTLAELRSTLAAAEAQVTGGLSPRVAPMAEIRDLGALLQRAGFALPVADSLTLTVNYRDAFHLMRDLRAMGEANALAGRLRQPTRRTVLAEAARLYAAHHRTDDRRVSASFELITLTGWAPAPGQQQPLRPGSAQTRLADALRVPETSLRPDDRTDDD